MIDNKLGCSYCANFAYWEGNMYCKAKHEFPIDLFKNKYPEEIRTTLSKLNKDCEDYIYDKKYSY